jgi:ATP-binding cassette subfamily B protein RaxB
VDRVLVGRDRDLLTVLGIAFATLVIISVAVTAVRAWVGVYLSTNINLKLLTTLFSHMLRLPLAWFEKRNIGDIVSKFRSVDAIQRTLTTTFVETAVDGIMVILTLVVMSFYSGMLTLVVVGGALSMRLPGGASTTRSATRPTSSSPTRRAPARTFIETLRGMMAIKLNLRESERRSAYQNLVVDQTNAGVRVQNVGILQRAANGMIFGLENVIVIWLAALLVMDGRFTVGMLYAFIGFKLVFLTRVINLVDKWNEFRMLDLHAERIADIALAEPETTKPSLPGEHVGGVLSLEAFNLSFAYGPEGYAFRGVSLAVSPGETIAIVGPSGCGKTTLIKVLLGLLPPTDGRGARNGRNLADWDLGQYRARDRRGDAGRSALRRDDRGQHQLLRLRPRPARVRECARDAMIDDEIMAMPMQYNTIVGSLGMALSGGQKQRILLARALYRAPTPLPRRGLRPARRRPGTTHQRSPRGPRGVPGDRQSPSRDGGRYGQEGRDAEGCNRACDRRQLADYYDADAPAHKSQLKFVQFSNVLASCLI